MGDPETDRESLLARLKWSLQALAIPATEQLALFPDFVCKSDELALDFDDARLAALGGIELSPAQRDAIDTIDAKLSSISRNGPEFADDLWSDEAVQHDPQWTRLRGLAGAALRAFGWPVEPPPRNPRARGAVYVRGGA